ncbi:MAG: hypothetical protein AB7E32_03075 [Desulfovibrio sp.]
MTKGKQILLLVGIGALLLVAGYFGAVFMAGHMAEQKVKEFFAGMDDVAHAEYGKVEVGLFSHEAVIHDLNVAVLGGRDIRVETFTLSRYEEQDGLPHVLKVRFAGVTLPVTPEYFGASATDMQAMGYEEFRCDYAMDYEYHEKDKSFDLRELSMAVADAGELQLSFKLANVNLKDLVNGGSSAMLVGIAGASLRYADDSLLSRAVRVAAADENLSEEQLMERFHTAIDAEIETNRDQGEPFTVQVLEQLRRFMDNRKSLSVTLAPSEPVAVLQLLGLEDTAKVVDTLGIRVEAE